MKYGGFALCSMKNNKTKERGLVLPKNFIQSYLEDLDQNEKVEIMDAIFNWFLSDEIPTIENKLPRVLFMNLLGFLETSKQNYQNGKEGGAPSGNQNAKKNKTTPVDLENNPHCFTEQPPLKNQTTLSEEKRKEEKRKEVKLKETRSEMNILDFDMFSDEAQNAADNFLKSKYNL